MITPEEPKAEPQPELKKKISIRVFGMGGAGCNAVNFIAQNKIGSGVDFYGLNTDVQALELCALPNKVVLGAKRSRGLGAGGDPELGRCAAEDDVEKMRVLCKGIDMVFLLVGLGGGTGTGASPILAQVAKESGALVMAVVTLPFEFEGNRRQRQAQLGLQQLKAAADAVICLPNEKLFKLIDEKTSVVEGFKISNELLAQGVRGIWRLLTDAGLINVDFADLCSVTRGRHAESSFATAEAAGEKRGEQVLEKLFAHPLLDGGQVLSDSDAVLVSIVGGPDLTMAEVNRLMAQLNRQCENAHLILGAAIDPEFANRLSVTLIASRDQAEDVSPARSNFTPTPVPAPEPSPAQVEQASSQFLDPNAPSQATTRFVAPPPSLTPERRSQLMGRQSRRKKAARLQKELPLEIISKGRFEKSEPTVRHGEDLDVPTYIRRGVALN